MLFHVVNPLWDTRGPHDIALLCNTLAWYIEGTADKNGGMLPDHEVITGRSYAEIVGQCCRIAKMAELPLPPRVEQLNIMYALINGEGSLGHPGLVRAYVTLPVISTTVAVIMQVDNEDFTEPTNLWRDNDLRSRIVKLWVEILGLGASLGVRDAAVQAVESKMILALRRWSLTARDTRLSESSTIVSRIDPLTVGISAEMVQEGLLRFFKSLERESDLYVEAARQLSSVASTVIEGPTIGGVAFWEMTDAAVVRRSMIIRPAVPRCCVPGCGRAWSADGSPVQRCSGCGQQTYCSKACQKKSVPRTSDSNILKTHSTLCLGTGRSINPTVYVLLN